MNIYDYKKIVIIGSAGSGKSWLSKRIADATGYQFFHLDKAFWQPKWALPSLKERVAIQQIMLDSGDAWIVEGHWKSTMEPRFAVADLIIFLDINRFVRLLSIVRRQGNKRSDFPDYLEEASRFSIEFLKHLKEEWIATNVSRQFILELHEKHKDTAFLHIRSRNQMAKLLRNSYSRRCF